MKQEKREVGEVQLPLRLDTTAISEIMIFMSSSQHGLNMKIIIIVAGFEARACQ